LSVFPWTRFHQAKAAVKMHTLLDLRGNIPTFIHISDGKMHEVNVLDILIPEASSSFIMDHGFTDFARWFTLHQAQAFFVIRYSRQIQPDVSSRLLPRRGQKYRVALRPDHCINFGQGQSRLPATPAPHQVLRCRTQEISDLSNQ
jgi:hypothetical protein